MRYFVIIILFVLSTCAQPAYGSDPPFKGDYKTITIRSLWMSCFEPLRSRYPNRHPEFYSQICDCVTDTMRQMTSFEDFNKMSGEDQYQLSFKISTMCLQQVSKPIVTPARGRDENTNFRFGVRRTS